VSSCTLQSHLRDLNRSSIYNAMGVYIFTKLYGYHVNKFQAKCNIRCVDFLSGHNDRTVLHFLMKKIRMFQAFVLIQIIFNYRYRPSRSFSLEVEAYG
jgi:hypothetical protein